MERRRSPVAMVYPRVCGDPALAPLALLDAIGLPPRMRGSLVGDGRCPVPERSTPAYAGIPGEAALLAGLHAVYPRVCGDPRRGSATRGSTRGLPPRMRGSRRPIRTPVRCGRSTPAYAGIPPEAGPCVRAVPVYPRVCGDPADPNAEGEIRLGLPPRMRGSLEGRHLDGQVARSTPAYAGIPPPVRMRPASGAVYPRVCGDPPATCNDRSYMHGLPPRMRGSPAGDPQRRPTHRSTPAYAGIPSCSASARAASSVYPRVCGDPWHPCAIHRAV